MVTYYKFTTFNIVFYNFHPFIAQNAFKILSDFAGFKSRIRDLTIHYLSGHLTKAPPQAKLKLKVSPQAKKSLQKPQVAQRGW